MARLLTFFLIFVVAIAQASSIGAAICQHQSAAEHQAARQSLDQEIASSALGEEAAAAMSSKKGSKSAGASLHWPVQMLPSLTDLNPFRTLEPISFHSSPEPKLKSAFARPLLEPPAA